MNNNPDNAREKALYYTKHARMHIQDIFAHALRQEARAEQDRGANLEEAASGFLSNCWHAMRSLVDGGAYLEPSQKLKAEQMLEDEDSFRIRMAQALQLHLEGTLEPASPFKQLFEKIDFSKITGMGGSSQHTFDDDLWRDAGLEKNDWASLLTRGGLRSPMQLLKRARLDKNRFYKI